MIHSNTSFGKLKEVIVGRELDIDKRLIDLTFKLFYKENLKQDVYEKISDSYCINKDLIQQRNEELDNLAKTLESFDITVYRPNKLKKLTRICTPTFTTETTSANNVRDVSFVYKDKIIETPVYVRNRYFEDTLLYDIFNKCFDNGKGGQWIKAPHTQLTENTIDLDDWHKPRDFNVVPDRFEMAIDGAQFLRIGKDVIVNITTYNHWRGFQWIKSFFPDTEFHMISIADNHIDGAIICLKPGVFLVDPKYRNIRDLLPSKFSNWTYLMPNENDLTKDIDVSNMTDMDIRLASSRGMDINILSIDENTCIVTSRAKCVQRILEKNHFTAVPVELNNGEIFAGGIHCSTLDVVRDDEYIFYT